MNRTEQHQHQQQARTDARFPARCVRDTDVQWRRTVAARRCRADTDHLSSQQTPVAFMGKALFLSVLETLTLLIFINFHGTCTTIIPILRMRKLRLRRPAVTELGSEGGHQDSHLGSLGPKGYTLTTPLRCKC